MRKNFVEPQVEVIEIDALVATQSQFTTSDELGTNFGGGDGGGVGGLLDN